MQLDLAGTSVLLVAMEVCDRFGKLEQYGTHHCKYAILFYSTGVRVIITTANFIETDFCKLTNAVYVQDFPLLESSIPTPRAESHSRFKEDLTFFLQHQAKHCFGASGRSRPRPWPQSDLGRDALNRQVMIDMIRRLQMYDLSAAEVNLVASVPGRHSVDIQNEIGRGERNCVYNARELGAFRLSELIKEFASNEIDEKVENSEKRGIVMQFSSFSSLGEREKYLGELIEAMTVSSPSPSSSSSSSACEGSTDIHIVWPTSDSVRRSNEGYRSGRSLPAQQKNICECVRSSSSNGPERWRMKPILRPLLRRWDGSISGRARVMPHMKCFFGYVIEEETNPSKLISGAHQNSVGEKVLIEQMNHKIAKKRRREEDVIERNAFRLDFEQDERIRIRWFCLTSCNLSMAAWGKRERNGSQLYIKSYELGVFFSPDTEIMRNHSGMRSFSCTPLHPVLGLDTHISLSPRGRRAEKKLIALPVPFKCLPESYLIVTDEEDDEWGDKPWAWDAIYPGEPDDWGLCGLSR